MRLKASAWSTNNTRTTFDLIRKLYWQFSVIFRQLTKLAIKFHNNPFFSVSGLLMSLGSLCFR